jgi:hypothetical protein
LRDPVETGLITLKVKFLSRVYMNCDKKNWYGDEQPLTAVTAEA